jgi:hypothetical protein
MLEVLGQTLSRGSLSALDGGDEAYQLCFRDMHATGTTTSGARTRPKTEYPVHDAEEFTMQVNLLIIIATTGTWNEASGLAASTLVCIGYPTPSLPVQHLPCL